MNPTKTYAFNDDRARLQSQLGTRILLGRDQSYQRENRPAGRFYLFSSIELPLPLIIGLGLDVCGDEARRVLARKARFVQTQLL
jgi:hypothetical protein